jgi:hypothetical protein
MQSTGKSYSSIYGLSVLYGYAFWIIFGLFDELYFHTKKNEYISNELWWIIFITLPILLSIVYPLSYIIFRFTRSLKAGTMFDRFTFDTDLKKFAGLTANLNSEQYINLRSYFKSMGISFEKANNFLESCRGIAFLEEFKSTQNIKPSDIAKMIIETERSEQILSCAFDILKEY